MPSRLLQTLQRYGNLILRTRPLHSPTYKKDLDALGIFVEPSPFSPYPTSSFIPQPRSTLPHSIRPMLFHLAPTFISEEKPPFLRSFSFDAFAIVADSYGTVFLYSQPSSPSPEENSCTNTSSGIVPQLIEHHTMILLGCITSLLYRSSSHFLCTRTMESLDMYTTPLLTMSCR